MQHKTAKLARLLATALGLCSVSPLPAQNAVSTPTMPVRVPLPPVADAAATPGGSIVARDEPVGDFVRDLFSKVGRPVVASPSLQGTVNGTFTGSTDRVFAQIAKAFNLVGYYDGAAFYVYGAKELSVQTLPVGPAIAGKVVHQVAEQHLADARNFVRAAADGNLVASGTPRFIEQVTALSQGGTMPTVSPNAPVLAGSAMPAGGAGALGFRVFYLRYARAEDTQVDAGGREVRIPGLATVLQDLVLDRRPSGQAVPQFGSFPLRQSQPRLKGLGLGALAPNLAQTPVLGLPVPGLAPGAAYQGVPGSDASVYSGVGGMSGQLGQNAGLTNSMVAPLTQDVVRIEPEPYLNAIIVRDVPERMPAYDSLIRALDVEPQLVEVEATIIDINVDKLRQLGVNWRINTGGVNALFGTGDSGDTALSKTGGSRSDNAFNVTPMAAGGTLSTVVGSARDFIARITALQTQGAARIVSRPQVMTLANVEAVFDRTQTFYVKVAGREDVDLFNVTAGTVLRVNPHVFRDHDQTRMRLLVNIEDGSISPNSMVQNIPIVEKSSVSTQAMVTDGQSLLLGGMTVDQDMDNEIKIPLLGDIPVLGNLFKMRTRNRGHTERLFLITPRLAQLSSPVNTQVTTTSEPAVQTPVPVEKLK